MAQTSASAKQRLSRDTASAALYDVVVVGAGPAGSSAARSAAEAGLSVLILDQSRFPRYKTCGGGLMGLTIANLPPGFEIPVRANVDEFSFSYRGNLSRRFPAKGAVLPMVNRAEFDQALLNAAIQSGAEARTGITAKGIDESLSSVTLRTTAGHFQARWVIAADGSTSRIARHIGAKMAHTDLGLEVELDVSSSESVAKKWKTRVHVDWGPIPGSYAWVFPKGDTLTVGVIAAKGHAEATRKYLDDFLVQQQLSDLPRLAETGHLTRWRNVASPLGRGRVLLAGDAAGLLEPFTREGISFAIRSGLAAGSSLTATEPQEAYRAAIADLLADQDAGVKVLRAFSRTPFFFHAAVMALPSAFRYFVQFTTGDSTLSRPLRRRPIRVLVRALAFGPGAQPGSNEKSPSTPLLSTNNQVIGRVRTVA